MKKIILTIMIGLLGSSAVQARQFPLLPEIKDNEKGSKISLYIPGVLIKAAALFIDKEDEEAGYLLKRTGTVRILVREGMYYAERSDKKFVLISRKMEKRDFTPLITVMDDETKVQIHARLNKNMVVRQLVIMVDDQENFVLLKIIGRYDLNKILELASQGDLSRLAG